MKAGHPGPGAQRMRTGRFGLAIGLPPRPGDPAKRTLLCTGRPFRQWPQAAGGQTDNAPAPLTHMPPAPVRVPLAPTRSGDGAHYRGAADPAPRSRTAGGRARALRGANTPSLRLTCDVFSQRAPGHHRRGHERTVAVDEWSIRGSRSAAARQGRGYGPCPLPERLPRGRS
jgi:hypothetical protein